MRNGRSLTVKRSGMSATQLPRDLQTPAAHVHAKAVRAVAQNDSIIQVKPRRLYQKGKLRKVSMKNVQSFFSRMKIHRIFVV